MRRLLLLLLVGGCVDERSPSPAGGSSSSDGVSASPSSSSGSGISELDDPTGEPAPGTTTGQPIPGSEAGTSTDEASGESTGEPLPAPAWPAFEDVSLAAGVDAPHQAFLGHHAIGQAWGDYDRDGWLDLYVTGGTTASVLYHNEGDGTFTVSPYSATVALTMQLTAGPAWGDYDNDGWLDLYVTCKGHNYLYHNEAGAGFTDQSTTAGVGDDRYGVMAAWGDYDRDGWLDLYVANHGGDHDMFYRNEGDGTFSDVGHLLGAGVYNHTRAAFAATFIDYDHDGDLDLHVVNDHIQGNDLFRNDGPGCGGWCFPNVRDKTGTGIYINGMGQGVGDYDNDGDLDLFFSDIYHTHLMQSLTAQGMPKFQEIDAGLEFPAISWGTVFLDYDNDGWLDVYLATQHNDPLLSNRLFRNRGDGTFEDVTELSGAADLGFTYGVGYADYDHDGFVDLVVGNRGSGYVLYRNTTTTGPGHHWVTFDLRGGGPINRDAIGARVTVTDTHGTSRVAEVRSGSTMGGGNSMRLHFGLGTAQVDQVHVRWPDGLEQVLDGLPTDALVTLAYP